MVWISKKGFKSLKFKCLKFKLLIGIKEYAIWLISPLVIIYVLLLNFTRVMKCVHEIKNTKFKLTLHKIN